MVEKIDVDLHSAYESIMKAQKIINEQYLNNFSDEDLIKLLPRMTVEQRDAPSAIIVGMVRECEYSMSPSGYVIWDGQEWQPSYQSRIDERDVSGILEIDTNRPSMFYPRNEDGSLQWDKASQAKESVGMITFEQYRSDLIKILARIEEFTSIEKDDINSLSILRGKIFDFANELMARQPKEKTMSVDTTLKVNHHLPLDEKQVNTINKIKDLENHIFSELKDIYDNNNDAVWYNWQHIGKIHIQQGFMALIRAVARADEPVF